MNLVMDDVVEEFEGESEWQLSIEPQNQSGM